MSTFRRSLSTSCAEKFSPFFVDGLIDRLGGTSIRLLVRVGYC